MSELKTENLTAWGWDEEWHRLAVDHGAGSDLLPARVVRHVHHSYDVVAAPEGRRFRTEVSGAFAYRAAGPADYPTAGDWVLVEAPAGRIQQLLPRRSAVRRNVAGEETLEQVITANLDVLLLVFGLDGERNFTVGLLERSVVVAWNSGARPVVVLNKADLADEDKAERAAHAVRTSAPGVASYQVSALTGAGLDELSAELGTGVTVGMLGKSGVGKSALLNALALRRPAGIAGVPAADGAGMLSEGPARVGAQRAGDLQGRHTTTDKQLYILPSGAVLADVPGLRELQLWGDETDVGDAFPEVEELAGECRFSDCRHQGEPGCRVQEALATGELDPDRYARYLDYRRELAFVERRRDERAMAEERKKWKKIAIAQRSFKKGR